MKVTHVDLNKLRDLINLLSKHIETGLIFLHGDLGVGKSTLVRYWLAALGYKGHVKSPTYTLVEQYLLKNTIYHFDLYRLNSEEEWEDLGGRDYLQKQHLIFIEWPEKARLPEPDLHIYLQYLTQDTREISFVTSCKEMQNIIYAL